MSDERPETCPNCHAPVVCCKCLEELESLIATLQGGVSNESNLTLILNDIESTSDDLLTYSDGDVTAKVYGNMGLGIDAETYARYLALCATLVPSLLKERESTLTFRDALTTQFEQMTAEKDGAYHERNQVVAFLSKLFPASLERHTGADWGPDWQWVVIIDTPAGQVSWHVKSDELGLFDHLQREAGRTWDGHTTDEKYARLVGMGPQPLTLGTPVMTAQEWGSLSAQARHNLNVWAMNANRTSEELERAQDKLNRILEICKTSLSFQMRDVERIITGQSTDPIDIEQIVNGSDATPGDIRQVVEGMKRAVDHE
jgi:hypothetical protein